MNITNADFKAIASALELLPSGDDFKNLPKEKQNIIVNAEATMINLLTKKRRDNDRTAKYIAEKRKTNKNYGR